MIEVKFLLNTNMKLVSPAHNCIHRIPPVDTYIDDVTFDLQENLIISETVYDIRKLTMEHL